MVVILPIRLVRLDCVCGKDAFTLHGIYSEGEPAELCGFEAHCVTCGRRHGLEQQVTVQTRRAFQPYAEPAVGPALVTWSTGHNWRHSIHNLFWTCSWCGAHEKIDVEERRHESCPGSAR